MATSPFVAALLVSPQDPSGTFQCHLSIYLQSCPLMPHSPLFSDFASANMCISRVHFHTISRVTLTDSTARGRRARAPLKLSASDSHPLAISIDRAAVPDLSSRTHAGICRVLVCAPPNSCTVQIICMPQMADDAGSEHRTAVERFYSAPRTLACLNSLRWRTSARAGAHTDLHRPRRVWPTQHRRRSSYRPPVGAPATHPGLAPVRVHSPRPTFS